MTIRKILVASMLSVGLAVPAYAGVLGIGGESDANIGLDERGAGAGLGLGAGARGGIGGTNARAGVSADVNADVGTPDVSRTIQSTGESGRAGAEAAASSANVMAVRASEKLQSLGYSKVRLASDLDAKAGSDLKFDAVNPKGENVAVTMNGETSAIVNEESRL